MLFKVSSFTMELSASVKDVVEATRDYTNQPSETNLTKLQRHLDAVNGLVSRDSTGGIFKGCCWCWCCYVVCYGAVVMVWLLLLRCRCCYGVVVVVKVSLLLRCCCCCHVVVVMLLL